MSCSIASCLAALGSPNLALDPTVPCPFGRYSKLVYKFPSCIVHVHCKLPCFCCVSNFRSVQLVPSVILLCIGGDFLGVMGFLWILYLCLFYPFLCGLSMCRKCSVSLQVFRRNCSICKCKLDEFMRVGKFRVFLLYKLGSLSTA